MSTKALNINNQNKSKISLNYILYIDGNLFLTLGWPDLNTQNL